MEEKSLVCVVCPIGCHLQVDTTAGYRVTGNQCKRGILYAREELTAPKRVVTSTVRISGAIYPRLPVRTSKAIPKKRVFECMQLINSLRVSAPITMGTVLVDNLLDLEDVQLIASRDM